MVWLTKSKFLTFYQSFSDAIIVDPEAPVDLKAAVIGTGAVIHGPSSSVFTPPTENKPPIMAKYKYIRSKYD